MAMAIETKYVGPTNTRGSRVSASTMDDNPRTGRSERASVSWDHEFEQEGNHRRALEKLLEKTGIGSNLKLKRWKPGGTKKGYVWVYV